MPTLLTNKTDFLPAQFLSLILTSDPGFDFVFFFLGGMAGSEPRSRGPSAETSSKSSYVYKPKKQNL